MGGTEPSTDKSPWTISPTETNLSAGAIAAINDLAHHTGTLHIDANTSTVRIQNDNGYDATYDLTTGQLLTATRKSGIIR